MDPEAGAHHSGEGAPPVPNVGAPKEMNRDKSGMALNQDDAVTNLDPRYRAKDPGHEQGKKMGTSTQAIAADEHSGTTPDQGIGVSRDWRLESE